MSLTGSGTRAEVPWTAEGFASQALHCLLCAYGVYARDRHRALADCEAGVWLLAQRFPVSGDSVLAAMRRISSLSRQRYKVWPHTTSAGRPNRSPMALCSSR